jgi:hypothetical protein
MRRWPLLQALPAYAVGVGVRPEHVRSPVRSVRPAGFVGFFLRQSAGIAYKCQVPHGS